MIAKGNCFLQRTFENKTRIKREGKYWLTVRLRGDMINLISNDYQYYN